MAIVFVGVDLAKNVFAVHGVNDAGKPELVRPAIARGKLLELIAALPPCTIGMEACTGAHHWAREFEALGHTVRLMAPKFVAPHRISGKRGKNDAADAALEDLPGWSNTVVGDLLSEVARLDERIAQYDRHIAQMARDDERVRRLMQLTGVGETTATALVAMIGNARDFDSGRQLSAWLGLVPGQYSSGGKTRLGRITKAGDPYLRSLLVMGARAVLNAAKARSDSLSRWAVQLEQRRGYWRAIVAIAAKTRAWPGRCSIAASSS